MDPWHIVELLALGIVAIVAWRFVRRACAPSRRARGSSALTTSLRVSEERDVRYEEMLSRLERAVDRLTNVVRGAEKHMTPGEMPAVREKKKPIPREESDE